MWQENINTFCVLKALVNWCWLVDVKKGTAAFIIRTVLLYLYVMIICFENKMLDIKCFIKSEQIYIRLIKTWLYLSVLV